MPKHKLEPLEQPAAASCGLQQHRASALDMQQEHQQPPAKRRRVPHLNFSIESMMQPEGQRTGASHIFSAAVSRSPSPGGLSEAESASSGSTGTLKETRAEGQAQFQHQHAGSRTSNSISSSSNNNNNNSNHHTHTHIHQHHRHHHHRSGSSVSSSDSSSGGGGRGGGGELKHEPESGASSRSSSRVSSPISPGWNRASPACELGHAFAGAKFGQSFRHQHLSSSPPPPPQAQGVAPYGHDHHNQQQQHLAGASSSSPSAASVSGPLRGARLGSKGTAAASAASATVASVPGAPNGSLGQVECLLDNKDMWDKFHSLNTEMIITKTGRRMFPVLKVQFLNLDPSAKYAVSMSIVPVDNKRYRYAYHKSCWQVAGKADPSAETRIYPHPDSPFNGDLLARQVISFEKVKLTNNEMDKSGHIILNSMHKYQPQVHLIKLKSQPAQAGASANSGAGQLSLSGAKLTAGSHALSHGAGSSSLAAAAAAASATNRIQPQQSQQQQQPAQLEMEDYRTFVFSETVFTAVTAYQNQLITKMKIDKNPFAKGFRDSSRLSDLDRNDPFDYMGALGPAAAAAAAAACAAGRAFGPPLPPPPGPGGAQPSGAGSGQACGPGQPFPQGALEAAAAAAAAAMPPGHHHNHHQVGQMDQAYAQLLAASAAATQSPWYPAPGAGGPSPFGAAAAAAACSTAQAAQHLQTQLWLAAFSACLNNGGQPNPPTPLVGPTPPPGPPGPPGLHQIGSNISSPVAELAPTPGQERRCEGRSS